MRTLAVLLTSFVFASHAPAQTGVPPQVHSVASGGYWSSGRHSGVYRVIVVNEGFEHVASRVFVEWIAEPTSPTEDPTVIAVVEPSLPFGAGVASLQATLKPLAPNRVRVALAGVVSAEPSQKVRAVVIATAPGLVSVAANPSIERTASSRLRRLQAAAHVER